MLLLTSKGAAGVTGSGFIVLAATLSAVGHVPVAGPGADPRHRPLHVGGARADQPVGNGVATLVVASWTGDLDTARLRTQLDRGAESDDPDLEMHAEG